MNLEMSCSVNPEFEYRQQILALDAKLNRYRSQDVTFRKNYLKRRMQLLNSRKPILAPSHQLEQLAVIEGKKARQPESALQELDKENPSEAVESERHEDTNHNQTCDCCTKISVDESPRRSIRYLQIRSKLLKRKVEAGLTDHLSNLSFSLSTSGVESSENNRRLSTTNESPRLTEIYDFRGLHHVSDLHRAPVTQLMFKHNENQELVAASLDGTISVYRLDTEPPSVSTTLSGHTKGVTDFDISVSNELLVSSCQDGSLYLWNLGQGRLLRRVPVCKDQLLSCKFLPGNNNLVVCGSRGVAGGTRGGSVQIINISTGKCPSSGSSCIPGSALSLAADSQDSLVWTGTDRGTIIAFRVDCQQGRLVKGHRHQTFSCRDSKPDTGSKVRGHAGSRFPGEAGIKGGDGGKITSLSCRRSQTTGKTMLLANLSQDLVLVYHVMDALGSLNIYRTFTVSHTNMAVRSVFSPLVSGVSGDCVVSASQDGAVYFFRVNKPDRAGINKLQAHSCSVLAVCFNSDESYLATSDQSGLIIVWKR